MDNMNYVCPNCGSNDWNPHGRAAICMSCGQRTPLEGMRKVKQPRHLECLNEVMPEDGVYPMTDERERIYD